MRPDEPVCPPPQGSEGPLVCVPVHLTILYAFRSPPKESACFFKSRVFQASCQQKHANYVASLDSQAHDPANALEVAVQWRMYVIKSVQGAVSKLNDPGIHRRQLSYTYDV